MWPALCKVKEKCRAGVSRFRMQWSVKIGREIDFGQCLHWRTQRSLNDRGPTGSPCLIASIEVRPDFFEWLSNLIRPPVTLEQTQCSASSYACPLHVCLALQHSRARDLVWLAITHRLTLVIVNAQQDTCIVRLVCARETDSLTSRACSRARDFELCAALILVSHPSGISIPYTPFTLPHPSLPDSPGPTWVRLSLTYHVELRLPSSASGVQCDDFSTQEIVAWCYAGG
jgi:hypothetical protein